MRVLDLFSGIGGFSLGLERAGMTTVAFCEIDPYCRRVLRKHWPDVPIFEDVRKLRGEDVGPVDLVCGGYPCQPFSTAGKRRGAEDDRHLWPEFSRLVDELRPTWVCGENVAGHISMGLDDVLSDLEGKGYACRAFVVPAVAVGAHHRRDRVWVVGHAEHGADASERGERAAFEGEGVGRGDDGRRGDGHAQRQVAHGSTREDPGALAHDPLHGRGQGRQGRPDTGGTGERERALSPMADADQREGWERSYADGERGRQAETEQTWLGCGALADADQPGPQGHGGLRERAGEQPAGQERRSEPGEWLPEPDVGRVAHGIPRRVDRLRALGNAVVPQIPEMIGRAIMATP